MMATGNMGQLSYRELCSTAVQKKKNQTNKPKKNMYKLVCREL